MKYEQKHSGFNDTVRENRKPGRGYYNNSGEKWWEFELNSNEQGGTWSDTRDLKNEIIRVPDIVGGREEGTIKDDFQVASVGSWLSKGLWSRFSLGKGWNEVNRW